ncbi:hypothetical protein PTSG_06267 [Salpingoeca rosetta]|uniref:Uncharacterized protein n=1 Tax=Salpingoeca rosetta (strain ATCC 50818 / BSB-021) TaxID=946362 RepID=F2UCE9_SALR5|nr:uncharacterized protein PTSG_06267 [Salpingoeca rosetta]EGD74256.1 hypothetical protein PTSG_06267 [Salpingoeca rosetta]|eukprot:XP_004993156.1 hypothetical protein PTSG_06267 [Salpingoeca rosetta]
MDAPDSGLSPLHLLLTQGITGMHPGELVLRLITRPAEWPKTTIPLWNACVYGSHRLIAVTPEFLAAAVMDEIGPDEYEEVLLGIMGAMVPEEHPESARGLVILVNRKSSVTAFRSPEVHRLAVEHVARNMATVRARGFVEVTEPDGTPVFVFFAIIGTYADERGIPLPWDYFMNWRPVTDRPTQHGGCRGCRDFRRRQRRLRQAITRGQRDRQKRLGQPLPLPPPTPPQLELPSWQRSTAAPAARLGVQPPPPQNTPASSSPDDGGPAAATTTTTPRTTTIRTTTTTITTATTTNTPASASSNSRADEGPAASSFSTSSSSTRR